MYFILWMDVIIPKKKWIKNKNMMKLMCENGNKHYQIIFMLTIQHPLNIPPKFRSQFDFLFLLSDDTIINKEKLYKYYANIFPDFDMFKTVFDQITKNYGCMVINNRIKSNDLKQKIFWYKANDIKK